MVDSHALTSSIMHVSTKISLTKLLTTKSLPIEINSDRTITRELIDLYSTNQILAPLDFTYLCTPLYDPSIIASKSSNVSLHILQSTFYPATEPIFRLSLHFISIWLLSMVSVRILSIFTDKKIVGRWSVVGSQTSNHMACAPLWS